MKKIEVPALPQLYTDSPLSLVLEALDALPKHALEEAPWPDEHPKPEVRFALAYHKDCLFLKYDVRESAVRATYLNTNDPVYRDSCVEFFIAFNGEEQYYNLEFNSLGTCLAGFGRDRHNRKLLSEGTISKIRRLGSSKDVASASRQVSWQLTLAIPAAVFSEHLLTDFTGMRAKANFYKCGDDLPVPHYLAWSPIQSPQPDFHLPGFFGEIKFR